MRTLIRIALAALLLAATPAWATDFKTWVPGLATKTTAPGATDYYVIVPNGGATEKVPGTSLLWSANNLSDLASAASARTNLGLGALATESALSAGQLPGLASGDLWLGNGSGVATAAALSGDCTLANTGALTCTKTNGAAFGSLATLNTLPLGDIAAIGADTVLGNATGASAAPTALSQAQLTALCDPFTSTLLGCVPASGGGTTNFLRADGTWAAPSGGGGSFSAPVNRITSGTTNTLSSISAPFTTELWVSASAGAKIDTVPGCVSGINGDYLVEVDGEGNAATNPLTVTVASGTIGPAGTPAPGTSYAVFANGGSAVFQCDGAATHRALVSATASAGRVNYQTGTGYTVAATDNGGVVDLNNASAIAVALPQAGTTGFPEGGFSTLLRASGAGAATVTPATSTLNGAASATIAPGNALLIFADGAGNYEGVSIQGPLGNSGVTAGSYTSANITVNAEGLVTAASNGSGAGGSSGLGVTYQANSWYWPYIGGNLVAGGAQSTGYTMCAPGVLLGSATIEGLAAYIGATATGNIQLAIYRVGSWGLPSTPVAATPSIAGAANTTVSGAFASAQSLTAGEYFFCAQVDTSGMTPGDLEASNTYYISPLIGGSSAGILMQTSGSSSTGYYVGGTFGTWPSYTSATSWSSTGDPIAVIMEVKSSP